MWTEHPGFGSLIAATLLAVIAARRHGRHLACGDAVGEASLSPGGTLVFGEIHGTREFPAAFGTIACNAAEDGAVVVGLEISRAEQPRIDAYLASDGGAAARTELLRGAHWSSRDGRSSEAMFGLIDKVRTWRAAGASVALVAFDVDGGWDDRDEDMTGPLVAARRAHPDAPMVVLVGNYHARLASKEPRMAAYLARQIANVDTFDAAYGKGTAWVCTDRGCGVHDWGEGEDPGPTRITRDVVIDRDGNTVFHGHLHVGRITASYPAR